MAMQRDFWVKNEVFGGMAMQRDFWGEDGVWEKIAAQRDFWVKNGILEENGRANGLLGKKIGSLGKMAVQRDFTAFYHIFYY